MLFENKFCANKERNGGKKYNHGASGVTLNEMLSCPLMKQMNNAYKYQGVI